MLTFRLEKNRKLIENLLKKKNLLECLDPEHKKIKTLLLALGGGMRGVYGAGAGIGLEELGLAEVFDISVGISTGAFFEAYRLAKQAFIGASVYCQECCTANFLDYLRFGKILDIDYIEAVLEGRKSREKLDLGVLKKSRTQFFAGATRVPDGQGVFIDVKSAQPSPISAITASMAVEGLYGKYKVVNGDLYLDGMLAFPFPVAEVIEKFRPTDIVVLANCPEGDQDDLLFAVQRFFALTPAGFYLPGFIRKLVRNRNENFKRGLNYLRYVKRINIGIVWAPDASIGVLTQDKDKLFQAAENSRKQVMEIFK